MRKVIVSCLGAGVSLVALLAICRAQGPQSPQPAPSTGRVLVLENERTLTGDIERIGDQYRVKRLVGETWVPSAKALRLCASLEEAHAYLASRANLSDPDERIRLAEWCRQHGLHDQALGEARAAAGLRPNDERIRRLVTHLENAKRRAATPPTPRRPEKELARVEVTAESLSLFAAKVQPILMNACASCHTGGRGGAFQLTRIYGSTTANRRSLEQNLAAALGQVDSRQPHLSKLLLKAVSLHGPGMSQSPLKGRATPAYRTLEQWLMQTLASNPQLSQSLPPSTATAAMTPPPAETRAAFGSDRSSTSKPEVKPEVKPETKTAPPTPVAPKKESNDPVDPEAFNRTFHPGRKPNGG